MSHWGKALCQVFDFLLFVCTCGNLKPQSWRNSTLKARTCLCVCINTSLQSPAGQFDSDPIIPPLVLASWDTLTAPGWIWVKPCALRNWSCSYMELLPFKGFWMLQGVQKSILVTIILEKTSFLLFSWGGITKRDGTKGWKQRRICNYSSSLIIRVHKVIHSCFRGHSFYMYIIPCHFPGQTQPKLVQRASVSGRFHPSILSWVRRHSLGCWVRGSPLIHAGWRHSMAQPLSSS